MKVSKLGSALFSERWLTLMIGKVCSPICGHESNGHFENDLSVFFFCFLEETTFFYKLIHVRLSVAVDVRHFRQLVEISPPTKSCYPDSSEDTEASKDKYCTLAGSEANFEFKQYYLTLLVAPPPPVLSRNDGRGRGRRVEAKCSYLIMINFCSWVEFG